MGLAVLGMSVWTSHSGVKFRMNVVAVGGDSSHVGIAVCLGTFLSAGIAIAVLLCLVV